MRHSGLPLATSGSRASNTPCQARCAQNADHLAHNTPFSAFFAEVVCTLGTTPARTSTSPPPNERNFATRGSDTSATRAIHHKTARTCSETLAHGASLHPGYRTCHVAGFVPCMPWYVLLVRTWACYSESGQPRPRTEQRVNVRNRRPTCETAGSHAGHVGTQVAVAHSQSMTDHGAATHTGPRCSIHRNEANTTTYNSNFPTQQSQKVTLLATRFVHPPRWLHHLQHQLSRINKPKSHHKTNTFCPVTRKTPPAPVRRLPEGQTAMPLGGGRAWPDNEPTRRAKLAARTASGRAAAHGHTKQPSRDSGRVQSPARAPAATCARSSGHPDPPHARPQTQPRPRT